MFDIGSLNIRAIDAGTFDVRPFNVRTREPGMLHVRVHGSHGTAMTIHHAVPVVIAVTVFHHLIIGSGVPR